MKPATGFLAVSAALFLSGLAVAEEDMQVAYGKALVETNCAACHGIGADDRSAHAEAPELRTLSQRYPLDALEEAFVEGISTGHADMPEFLATPEQVAAIIAYIDSLEPR